MRFKDLKMRTKILSGFFIVILITIVVGIIGVIGLNSVGSSFREVSQVRMKSADNLSGIEASLSQLQQGYIRLLDNKLTREDRLDILDQISQNREEYTNYMNEFSKIEMQDREQVLYDKMISNLAKWKEINVQKVEKLHEELLEIDILNPIALNRDLELFMKDHYAVQVKASDAIQTMQVFDGGEDATACNFGKWMPTFNTSNSTINSNMNAMRTDHSNFHEAIRDIKSSIRRGNQQQALRIYEERMIPSADKVFTYFAVINSEAQRAVSLFDEMSTVISEESVAAMENFMIDYENFKELNSELANNEVEKGDNLIARSNSMVFSGLIIGIILALILGFAITRMVTVGLSKGVIIAENVANGDLTTKVDESLTGQKDEIGQLARAMQNMIEKLRDIIGSVTSGSNTIASASEQMSTTAQQMSQGGTEQASSAEEVSSSMEEMAANIQQNTDNAKQTEGIAEQAEKGIVDSSKASEQAVGAMRDIAEKITIIGEISRQTNILALNAAVEAARAGEHGKGFAVVAAEVRKLAERSQVAANEIDKLSKFGVEISEEAGQKLSAIVPEIQKTAQLVKEISAASIEQSSGADQVNSAIQQLNQVTQQNAAASEEMATNSEELASQADALLDMVAYFKIDKKAVSSKASHKTKASSLLNNGGKNTNGKTNGIQSNGAKNKGKLEESHANGNSNGINLKMNDSLDNEFENF